MPYRTRSTCAPFMGWVKRDIRIPSHGQPERLCRFDHGAPWFRFSIWQWRCWSRGLRSKGKKHFNAEVCCVKANPLSFTPYPDRSSHDGLIASQKLHGEKNTGSDLLFRRSGGCIHTQQTPRHDATELLHG